MSITVNEGGALYELDTVTSNEDGTLYELVTVHSNESGTLHLIYNAIPDDIIGTATGYGDTVVDVTGFTLTKSTTVTISISDISYGAGTTATYAALYIDPNAEFSGVDKSVIRLGNKTDSIGDIPTATLEAGTYYVRAQAGSTTIIGSSSGADYNSYAGSFDYTITFD